MSTPPKEVCQAHENAGRSAPLISPNQPDMKTPQLRVRVPHQTAIWDSISLLMRIGQGGATSSSVRSGDQGWFVQFGAVLLWERSDKTTPSKTTGQCAFDLCKKPQTCCRGESVPAAVPAAAVNPLVLRTLLPAPSGYVPLALRFWP